MKICISAGHGKYVAGAHGPKPWGLDEVKEARKVTARVGELLNSADVPTKTWWDDVSHSQDENLKRICDWHNAQTRELDISVHFNSTNQDPKRAVGTECWYVTQSDLAGQIATAIADSGHLIDRGAKHTNNLYFLNHTEQPACLIEVMFLSSKPDTELYLANFDNICIGIAEALAGRPLDERPELPERPPLRPDDTVWHEDITATVFGMEGDQQQGAYGEWIDEDTVGVSFPYKWRDQPRPQIEVEGPDGSITCGVVDVGPWNTDDPDYVLGAARPLAETQYAEGTEAQNGRVPTNDAGIDLTEPVSKAVGISGKGKVRWRIVS